MFNTAAGKNSPTSTGGEMNFRLGSGFYEQTYITAIEEVNETFLG